MVNIVIVDGTNQLKYLAGEGAGNDSDPIAPAHKAYPVQERIESNSALRANDTPGVYHTGDEVANSATAQTIFFTWNNPARRVGGSFLLVGVEFSTSNIADVNLYDLWLYNAIPALPNQDHQAFQTRIADRTKRQGVIEGLRPVAQGAGSDGSYAEKRGLLMPVFCAAGTNVIYGRLKVASAGAGAPTAQQQYNAALLVMRNW